MGLVLYSIFPFLIALIAFIVAFVSEGKYRAILFYAVAATAMLISADLSIIPYASGTMQVSAYNITTPSGVIAVAAHNITSLKPIIPGNLLLIYMMPAALFAILCAILAIMQAFNINPKAKLMG
jgi:hypothetical protein